MKVKSCVGNYVNIFNEQGLDLFVLLNEPVIVSTELYIDIENIITEHISRYSCIDENKLEEVLKSLIPDGFLIINKSFGYPKL